MNILAVGAHPDDVETMCAGTLAKYAAQGHKVFIATATNGNIGSARHTMEQIGRIRKQEAANSAAIIGAEYICLDYDDEMFFEIDRETRLKFITSSSPTTRTTITPIICSPARSSTTSP